MTSPAVENTARPAVDRTQERVDPKVESPNLAQAVTLADRQQFFGQTAGRDGGTAFNADGTINFGDPGALYRAPGDGQQPKPGDGQTDKAKEEKEIVDRPLVNENRAELNAAQERAQLESNLQKLPPELREKALADIQTLEHRQPPISERDRARIYDAANRLIENEGGTQPPLLSDKQRLLLASGVLDNAANPSKIDQGYHNTCNVTTLAERLNTVDPAAAAELVTDVALRSTPNGMEHGRETVKYTAPNGQEIVLDKASLMPDREASQGHVDGQRNYASQIFDMVTINQHWQSQVPGARYYQETPRGPGDTGERLADGEGRVHANHPAIGTTALAGIGKQLGFSSGSDNQPFLISNAAVDGNRQTDGVARVTSQEELEKTLAQAQENGGFPVVVMVHSGHKIFSGTSGEGGSGGWHVVSITGRNPDGTWQMSNQWGEKNDKAVSTKDLYEATLGARSSAGGSQQGGRTDGGRTDGGEGGNGGRGGQGGGGGGENGRYREQGRGMMTDEEAEKFKKEMEKKDGEAVDAIQSRLNQLDAEINAISNGSDPGRLEALRSQRELLRQQVENSR